MKAASPSKAHCIRRAIFKVEYRDKFIRPPILGNVAAPRQQRRQKLVFGDNEISTLDALVVINDLQRSGSRSVLGVLRKPGDPFCDVNGDGFVSPIDVLVVINTLNRNRSPLSIVGGVAPNSDANANGVVLGTSLTIVGQTFANIPVTISSFADANRPAIRARSGADGRFSIDVPMTAGSEQLQVTARDDLGRTENFVLSVDKGDVITDWNAAALNVIRDWTALSNDPYQGRIVPSQPPRVAKNLAMIHAAMFDAVNATSGQYDAYAFFQPIQIDASPVAAAASAAYRVASALYSDADEIAIWDATLAESISSIADDAARAKGLILGRQVGDAILAARANDGSTSASTYVPGNEPGHWNRTFPDYLPPLLSNWQKVKPFAIPLGNAFRPSSPPTLASIEYANAVDQVMRLGGLNSTERTTEQTEIALFWADGGGTATPPGHWNRIATDVIHRENLSLIESARTLALVNLAVADAGIASWDAKYYYDLWRPVDAIRDADSDGNVATVADTNWLPLLKTPPFPTYTSGHSTFSGAAAAVLTKLFGDNYVFISTADGHTGLAQRPLADSLITTREFTSFDQAAHEAGISRIYGGIHFTFDNTAGLATGKSIGEFVANGMLKRKATG
ncbi:MAG: phosphatase PAP2 family protein [Pirellulaceae bacterium]|nr:phosphatase PAP2 family protein [Pirellulaceae bacterium]